MSCRHLGLGGGGGSLLDQASAVALNFELIRTQFLELVPPLPLQPAVSAVQGGTAGWLQSAHVCDTGKAAGQPDGILLHRYSVNELDQGTKHSDHWITGYHSAWGQAVVLPPLATSFIASAELGTGTVTASL